jgi:hypothetical protein
MKDNMTKARVDAGLGALLVQARQIWGADELTLPMIVLRLTVGVGDLARLARDGSPVKPGDGHNFTAAVIAEKRLQYQREIKKELGNIIFSTIRWIDDLGLDVLECLDLAIEAQEKFAKSGRPR